MSVLIPHEPDLGFGRPHFGGSLPASLEKLAQESLKQPDKICNADAQACSGGLALVDTFQSVAVRSLAQVKADIEQSQRLRRRGGSLL